MRDANLYKEASEHGYGLQLNDEGASLRSFDGGTTIPLVRSEDGKYVSVVPQSFEADLASRIVRMMRGEAARKAKAEHPDDPAPTEPSRRPRGFLNKGGTK